MENNTETAKYSNSEAIKTITTTSGVDDIYNQKNIVIPELERLVMIRIYCRICGKKENILYEFISNYFGTLCCEEHQDNAKLGVYKYLDKNKLVKRNDLEQTKEWIEFHDKIMKYGTITTIRADGTISGDWNIFTENVSNSIKNKLRDDFNLYHYNNDDGLLLKVYKFEENDDSYLHKTIKLSTFMTDNSHYSGDKELGDSINKLLDLLKNNFYAEAIIKLTEKIIKKEST